MNWRVVLSLCVLGLFVGVVSIGAGLSHAQTDPTLTTEASRMDRIAGTLGEAKVIDRLSSEFSTFLGEDARAVVIGLRNGTPITLTRTVPGSAPGAPPVITKATITPPTGKMGFGNVFIALALAKQQLNQLGITQPTAEQLQTALLGGAVRTGSGPTATGTNLQGILTMRSQNVGWGQIAQKLGVKLGSVVSALKAANHNLVIGAVSPTGTGIVNAGGRPVDSSESGIVTGRGRSTAKPAKGVSVKSEGDEGMVTGSGRPMGSDGDITTGRGYGYGATGDSSGGAAYGKGHSK